MSVEIDCRWTVSGLGRGCGTGQMKPQPLAVLSVSVSASRIPGRLLCMMGKKEPVMRKRLHLHCMLSWLELTVRREQPMTMLLIGSQSSVHDMGPLNRLRKGV